MQKTLESYYIKSENFCSNIFFLTLVCQIICYTKTLFLKRFVNIDFIHNLISYF